ncbi:MAG: glycosyltransferase family 2 protein [bacterium]|nr:glycosyltransferase family 2 protein [bacterium]
MNDSSTYSVLVVVPAYNAARHLRELTTRLREFVCDENLLVVNDGSSDGTVGVLQDLDLNYISFPENRGKGAALMAGFQYAIEKGYRSVLTIDADLQHLPEEVPAFFAADNGRRVVIGTRKMIAGVMPFERRLTNNLTSLIISIFSFCRVRDSQSGFRLIPTEVLKAMRLKTVRYDFESEMLFQAGALGCRVAEVPISTVYEESTSYINPFRDTLRFIRQIWNRIWV